jgi:hypothetical protein
MVNKKEVQRQVQEWLDKSAYQDFMLETRMNENYLELNLSGLKEMNVQELLDEA